MGLTGSSAIFHGKEGPFPYRCGPSPHLPSGRPIRRRREEKSTSPFCLAGDRQRRGDRTSAAACAAEGRAVPGRAQSNGDGFIPAAARRRPKIYRPIRLQAQSGPSNHCMRSGGTGRPAAGTAWLRPGRGGPLSPGAFSPAAAGRQALAGRAISGAMRQAV